MKWFSLFFLMLIAPVAQAVPNDATAYEVFFQNLTGAWKGQTEFDAFLEVRKEGQVWFFGEEICDAQLCGAGFSYLAVKNGVLVECEDPECLAPIPQTVTEVSHSKLVREKEEGELKVISSLALERDQVIRLTTTVRKQTGHVVRESRLVFQRTQVQDDDSL